MMRAGVFGAAALNSCLCRVLLPGRSGVRPGVPMTYTGADYEEFQATTYEPWVKWPLMPEVSFMDTQMPLFEMLGPGAHSHIQIELGLNRIGDV